LTAPGVDVAAAWEGSDLMARREAIQALMELVITKGKRGARSLDPTRLDGSRWVGDAMTWGERRALAAA
jgi:hypothetical protein